MRTADSPKKMESPSGSLNLDVLGASLLAPSKSNKKRFCCGLDARELIMAGAILILSLIVVVLAAAAVGTNELPPYCLFAVGGGYLEGSETRIPAPLPPPSP